MYIKLSLKNLEQTFARNLFIAAQLVQRVILNACFLILI